jgi:hypothetical protein
MLLRRLPQRLVQSILKASGYLCCFLSLIGNQFAVIGLTEEGYFNHTSSSTSTSDTDRAFLLSSHYIGQVLFAVPVTIWAKMYGLKKFFVGLIMLTSVANAVYLRLPIF